MCCVVLYHIVLYCDVRYSNVLRCAGLCAVLVCLYCVVLDCVALIVLDCGTLCCVVIYGAVSRGVAVLCCTDLQIS